MRILPYLTHPVQRFNHAMAVSNTRWTLAQGMSQVLLRQPYGSGLHTPRYALAQIFSNERRRTKTLRRWWGSGIRCYGARQAVSRHAYHSAGYASSHLTRAICMCRPVSMTCLPDGLRQMWQRDCPDALKRRQVDFVPFDFLKDKPVLNHDIYYVCSTNAKYMDA